MAKGKAKSQGASDPPLAPTPGGVAKPKKSVVSKSAKAGLTFPVPRINRRLVESKTTKRVGAGAPIYATAVIEYFCAELLELSVNQMKADGKGRSRLTPTDVLKGLRGDEDLHKATNGLRVMVGDKAKDTADLITSKADMEVKYLAKMREADWFEYNDEHTIELNYKRFLKELKEREKAEAKGRLVKLKKDAERARLARKEERRTINENRRAGWIETRVFNQTMARGAKMEQAEDRAKRGYASTCLLPSDEVIDRKNQVIPKMRVVQYTPGIRISRKTWQANEDFKMIEKLEVTDPKESVRLKMRGEKRPLVHTCISSLPPLLPSLEEVAQPVAKVSRAFRKRAERAALASAQ